MKELKIHKKSLKTILANDWWIFVIIPLIFSLCFAYLFYLMDKPKNSEKIRIFSGFQVSDELVDKIHGEYLDNLKQYDILETSIYTLNENDSNYGLIFGDAIFNNYEIIIASEEEYNTDYGIFDNSTVNLDPEFIGDNFEYLFKDDKPIGVKIFDINMSDYNSIFTFNNIYLSSTTYLFVSSKTVNFNRLVDESHTLNELALKEFLKVLTK